MAMRVGGWMAGWEGRNVMGLNCAMAMAMAMAMDPVCLSGFLSLCLSVKTLG